jgi:hypothetical protein
VAHRLLTASIIADAAIKILENELVMANLVYRGYEQDFAKNVNGFEVGDTVSIRRPTDFTVRDGAVAVAQDVQEGKFSITVDKQKGVDFKFTSADLTLSIGTLAERAIRPAMIQLANQVDRDLMALYAKIPNWVGSPGQNIDAFADFAKAPTRLDLMAVPQDGRSAVLSPTDAWAMIGSQTALYMQDVAKSAYRQGKLGMIAGVDTYSTQNIATHTTGTRDDTTPVTLTAGTGVLSTTWASSRDTNTMVLSTKEWDASATLTAGDVFTIATVYDVNPVTKATLPHLKMFTVVSNTTADGTTSTETPVTISPAIIPTGAFQNVSNAPATAKAIVNVGTASTGYAQNMVFRKDAFSLVMLPLVKPPGATEVARKSTSNGLSVRVIPVYDGINDHSMWRLDILYGVKAIDTRQAVRLSGT